MELVSIVIGIVLGAALMVAAIAVREVRTRRSEERRQHRSRWADVLATSDTCYRLLDFIVTWPRRTMAGERSRNRTSARASTAINEAMTELDSHVRRMRQLVSHVQLAGDADILPHVTRLHESLEEGMLAMRMDSPAQLAKRWESVIAPGWRSSRDAFVEAARRGIGPLGSDS